MVSRSSSAEPVLTIVKASGQACTESITSFSGINLLFCLFLQMANEYITELRTSKAPPLVVGGDHFKKGYALFAILQPHPTKPGETVLCFFFFRLDPRLLTSLVLKWTKNADDLINHNDRSTFPKRILQAWSLLKHQVCELKCETVAEAEALAETVRELQAVPKPVSDARDQDSKEDDEKMLEALISCLES